MNPKSPIVLLIASLVGASGSIAGVDAQVETAPSVVEFSDLVRVSRIRVSQTPSIVLGTAIGDPRFEFALISDLAMLADGSIVVLDGGVAPQIRLFDATGTPLGTLGREGPGPGEFRYPQAVLALTGDTLVTWDNPVRQVVWLHPDQGVLRQEYNRGDAESAHDGALLPDGSRLIREVDGSANVRDQVTRYPAVLKRFIADSAVAFGQFPTREQYVDANGFPVGVPFAKDSHVAGGGPYGVVVAGDAAEWEIRVWNYDGTPRFTIRNTGGLEVANRAARSRAKERFLAGPIAQMRGAEFANRVWRTARLDRRNELPAFTDLWVDELGKIWVALWSERDRAGEPLPDAALVFDENGAFLGRVALPGGVHIRKIYAEHFIGDTRDEWGVQRVVLHRIER